MGDMGKRTGKIKLPKKQLDSLLGLMNEKRNHLKCVGISMRYSNGKGPYLTCLCDCGTLTEVRRDSFLDGAVKSCCNFKTYEQEKERFLSHVKKSEIGCWLWTACVESKEKPYGRFQTPWFKKDHQAHRISYLFFVGEIREKQIIRHKCHNPRCVNPAHLEPGTPRQNSHDSMIAGRMAHGERNGNSILSIEQVREIKNIHKQGVNAAEIGRKLEINYHTVRNIIQGRTWKHA